jgi:hypothetical protein
MNGTDSFPTGARGLSIERTNFHFSDLGCNSLAVATFSLLLYAKSLIETTEEHMSSEIKKYSTYNLQ